MAIVIPYRDSTGELFNAWRTMEDIKQKAQEVAINQQLAQAHIQSSQTIDQLNQQKLRVDQQNVDEYLNPDAITRRKESMDTALSQQKSNLDESQLGNEFRDKINPLMVAHQIQTNRQMRIAGDAAQQGLNHLHKIYENQDDLNDLSIKAKKYELMSQGGLDPHTADLLSQIQGVKAAETLKQLPLAAEAQQKALQNAIDESGSKMMNDRLRMVGALSTTMQPSAVKSMLKGEKGFEFLNNLPEDTLSVKTNEKDREGAILAAMTGDPDPAVSEPAIKALSYRLATASGWKPDSKAAQDALILGKPVPSDPILQSFEAAARGIGKRVKSNPQANPYNDAFNYIGDPAKAREELLRGKLDTSGQPAQTVQKGQSVLNLPAPPPQTVIQQSPPVTNPTVVSGTSPLKPDPVEQSNSAYDTALNRFKDFSKLRSYASDEDTSTSSKMGTVRMIGHMFGIGEAPKQEYEIFPPDQYSKFMSIPEPQRKTVVKMVEDSNATPKQKELAMHLVIEALNSDHPTRVFQAFGSVFGNSLTATQQALVNKVMNKYGTGVE